MKPVPNIRDYIRVHFPGVRAKRTLIGLARHSTGHGFEAQSRPIDSQSKSQSREAVTALTDGSAVEGASDAPIVDTDLMLDNADPMKASVRLTTPPRGLRRRIGIWKNQIKNFYHFLRPPLSPEEAVEREHQREYKQFINLMTREAVRYASIISGRLAQLNYYQVVPTEEPTRHREKHVRFSVAGWDWNEETREGGRVIKLLVDTNSLPRGVRLGDLANPITVNEMLPTLHHPCNVTMDIEGCIFTVQRGGVLGLPELVSIEKMWAIMGENRSPLTFCVGEAENSQVFWIDLSKGPHLMVAGASGQGKSNMINAILCTMIRNNKPETVRFILFDMKEGIEFTFYENLPHLYPMKATIYAKKKDDDDDDDEDDKKKRKPHLFETNAILDDPAQALDALYALKIEMVKRMNIIKAAGHKNIGSYNLHRYAKNRLPYLVIAFDEIATPLLYFGKRFERLLNELTNQARAAGMHFILGTQYPKAEILTTLVTINFPIRFAFSMPMGASMSVLGNHNAVGLPCPGRAILQRDGEDIQVQTPIISDAIVRATVRAAITGKLDSAPLVSIEDVLEWSVEQANGALKYEDIFHNFRKRGLRYQQMVEMLMSADGQEFEVNGEMYRVEPRFGRLPRRMVRVAPDGPDILPNPPSLNSEDMPKDNSKVPDNSPNLKSEMRDEGWFHGGGISVREKK